ncbi:hypothetical protein Rhe02_73250 [Rhizocola hellebori]|uniref:Serine protease n=1 Tax=Rhizocola hellebori TaxID=1392758 RepID=A0A8J3QE82_9ACTN|nr:hypothetical protein Rhe02_73250 [Rhizocola hellebori]
MAEVVAEFADGRRERGSGLWLRADVLITAWHVVADAVRVLAVFEAGSDRRRTATARSVVRLGSSDVAVACLDGLADESPLAVRVGGFDDCAAVVGAQVFGFPRFKVRNVDESSPSVGDGRRSFRELAQVPARLAPQGNWRTGRCELIVTPPDPDPDPSRSAWEGMSGAPVVDVQSGLLVAVVTDHHRQEGLSRLAAVRLDVCLAQLSGAEASRVLPLLGVVSVAGLAAAGVPPWVGWKRQALTDQLGEIVPAMGLRDRDAELADLTAFCAGPDSYVYWQAPPWAGKSALMATFALRPPAGVTVVPYFVTARYAGENDSTGFLRTVSAQLAALMGEALPNLVTTREGYRAFLGERARQAYAVGQQLVLLVDGLDEDSGTHAGSGVPSIASLLPRQPVPGLKVIVAGRPDPRLPGDVPADHPLRVCARRWLSTSPHALQIGQIARLELMELLARGGVHREVVGLIAASGGGVTVTDLEELTGQPRYIILDLLGSVFGRTLRGRLVPTANDAQHVYLFAHDTLREQALGLLGGELTHYRQHIHTWADSYRRRQWPHQTPGYLLTGYPRLLDATGDLVRLAALAEDAIRHDRMLAHTGGDDTAYAEINMALSLLAAAAEPDIRTIVRIARHRESLQLRNSNIPDRLPALWARLGNLPRAEALARSIADPSPRSRALATLAEAIAGVDADRAEQIARTITDPDDQVQALTGVAKAIADVDLDRALRLASQAEQIARNITDSSHHAEALTRVATVIAGVDVERAVRIARTITDPAHQAEALTRVATAIAGVDVDRAVRIARTITEPTRLAEALTRVAKQVVDADVDRAMRIAGQAEQIARAITDPSSQEWALTGLTETIAKVDADRAEQIARTITDPYSQAWALTSVATAIAAVDVGRAIRLSGQAEQVARTITGQDTQIWMLTEIAAAIASFAVDQAEQIARSIAYPRDQIWALIYVAEAVAGVDMDRAEQIASTVTDPNHQTRALTGMAEAMADIDKDRAIRLIGQAELIARTVTNPLRQTLALTETATLIAGIDVDRAEQFARTITDPATQTMALTGLVEVITGIDIDRAERIARTLTGPHHQTRALTAVVKAIASVDVDRATRIADEVEQIARTITDPYPQTLVLMLTDIATAIASLDMDRARRFASYAEQVARAITGPYDRTKALTGMATAIAGIDVDWAVRLADQAEQTARTITDPYDRTKALTGIATAIAGIDVDRAVRLADLAEQIARTLTDADRQTWALTDATEAIAGVDVERAKQIARTIADPIYKARALTSVAEAIAGADVDQTLSLAHEAEQIARTITGPYDRTNVLTGMATAIAGIDVGWAVRLADQAEQIARTITDPLDRAHALERIALGVRGATPPPLKACKLVAEAIQLGLSWRSGTKALPHAIQQAICDDLFNSNNGQPIEYL